MSRSVFADALIKAPLNRRTMLAVRNNLGLFYIPGSEHRAAITARLQSYKALYPSLEAAKRAGLETEETYALCEALLGVLSVSIMSEDPYTSGEPENIREAVGIAVSGVELLDNVKVAYELLDRPGYLRTIMHDGSSFLLGVENEDFVGTDEFEEEVA